jgi:hypothetical protein
MTTPVTEGRVKSSRKRPADFTGRQTEQLNEAHKTERIEQSQRIALVNAELEEEKNIIVDYTGSEEPMPAVEVRQVEVNSPNRMIRVNSDIDQMTYGREVIDPGDYTASPPRPAILGSLNTYNFKEGQVYRVPKEVADHLNDKGYIAYMSGA